jgi:hypothetical protein
MVPTIVHSRLFCTTKAIAFTSMTTNKRSPLEIRQPIAFTNMTTNKRSPQLSLKKLIANINLQN